MGESLDIHSVIQSFLNQMQSIEIVKEYSLNTIEFTNRNFHKFEPVFKKFVQEVNTTLSSCNDIAKAPKIAPEISDIEMNVVHSNSEKNSPVPDLDVDREKCSQTPDLVKSNVQLQVDENEIKRRISAFLSRKRKEVDEWNVQEFCSRPYIDELNPVWEQMDSCARVDAVFIPRFGSKSHVKVSKVENRWGPQTQFRNNPAKRIKVEPSENGRDNQNNTTFIAIQERIQSLESHLNLKSENSARNSIFQRLKQLEDRILYLEGISPDYLNAFRPNYTSPKKKNVYDKEKVYSNWSVDDLQKRIQALKESLKSKSQIKREYPG